MDKLFKQVTEVPDRGFTHGCKFHSDDVFSTAFLRILNPDIEIERGMQAPEHYDGIIYDIGRGKFDHHQQDKEIRKNGCPYAAFGLIWREYGEACVGAEEAARFDETFIQPLDLSDNTGCANVLADIIDEFNPEWDSEESYDSCFRRAVDFAEQILRNHFKSVAGLCRAGKLVHQAMEDSDGTVLELPQYVPWKKEVTGSGYQMVVYPSNRGGYSVQGVPAAMNTTELVCAFPEEWRGKEASELPEISGIETLRFCHVTGFLAATDTREDAILAAQAALAAQAKA